MTVAFVKLSDRLATFNMQSTEAYCGSSDYRTPAITRGSGRRSMRLFATGTVQLCTLMAKFTAKRETYAIRTTISGQIALLATSNCKIHER